MDNNEKHLDAVKTQLFRLRGLKGFPPDEDSFNAIAGAYARFAASDPETYQGNQVIPLHWLVEAILDGAIFFPAPLEARFIYARRFRPLDGREPEDVQLAMPRGRSAGEEA